MRLTAGQISASGPPGPPGPPRGGPTVGDLFGAILLRGRSGPWGRSIEIAPVGRRPPSARSAERLLTVAVVALASTPVIFSAAIIAIVSLRWSVLHPCILIVLLYGREKGFAAEALADGSRSYIWSADSDSTGYCVAFTPPGSTVQTIPQINIASPNQVPDQTWIGGLIAWFDRWFS